MEKGKEKGKATKIRNYKRQIYLLILCMGIGFAFLTSQLNIVGVTSVKGGAWRVYFDNVQVSNGSVQATTPVIDNDKTRVDFQVTLNSPGDKYEFTIDAINAGEVNATIQSIFMTPLDETTAKYLNYQVTYNDDSEIAEADILEAGETETIKVLVEYKDNVLDEDILESNQTLNLTFSIDYIHATSKTPKRFVQLVKDSAKLDTNIDFSKSSFYTNGEGLYIKNDTKNSTNPIYYYRGDVNNNAVFAGQCWKIVRTTETGGTKLIYNGPQTYSYTTVRRLDEDEYTFVPVSYYEYEEPEEIEEDFFTFDESSKVWNRESSQRSSDYKTFGISVDEAGDYILHLSINEDVQDFSGYIYLDNQLIEEFSLSSYSWDFKIYGATQSSVIGINYYKSSGSNYGTDVMSFSLDKGVTGILGCDNTGRKSAINNYEGQFNEKDDSLAHSGYMYGTEYKYNYDRASNITSATFGTSVTYSDGKYTLVNSQTGFDSTHHYTCSNYCMNVQYVFYKNSSYYHYITLTGGRTLDDALTEMNRNISDSTAKTIIDEWFVNTIATPLANNNIDYNNYLEDTIWCNDRSWNRQDLDGTGKYSSNGWIPNGGGTGNGLYYAAYGRLRTGQPSLTCSNKNDSFTVEESATGNGALTYPVGLLTLDEVIYAGTKNGQYSTAPLNYYLNSGITWMTMTPRIYGGTSNSCDAINFVVDSSGIITIASYEYSQPYAYIRPSISIKSKVKVAADGDGTVLNPYVFIVR